MRVFDCSQDVIAGNFPKFSYFSGFFSAYALLKPLSDNTVQALDKQAQALQDLVISALEDMKAQDIQALNVEGVSSFTSSMIVASGTSTTHVKSIAENVVYEAKHAGHQPLGVEGDGSSEWVLVDLGDVVVHVMLPEVRAFYSLEKLWSDHVAKAETGH